jgi:hypothetical protein
MDTLYRINKGIPLDRVSAHAEKFYALQIFAFEDTLLENPPDQQLAGQCSGGKVWLGSSLDYLIAALEMEGYISRVVESTD